MNLTYSRLSRLSPGDASQIIDQHEANTERQRDQLKPATYRARMRRYEELRGDLFGRPCIRRMIRMIADDLEYSASWREQKAEEYRDDRNSEAAALLRRFSDELREVNPMQLNGSVHAMLATSSYHAGETESELIRDVGFREHPASGVDFLERLARRVGVE